MAVEAKSDSFLLQVLWVGTESCWGRMSTFVDPSPGKALPGQHRLSCSCTSTLSTLNAKLPVPPASPDQPCLHITHKGLSPADLWERGSWGELNPLSVSGQPLTDSSCGEG